VRKAGAGRQLRRHADISPDILRASLLHFERDEERQDQAAPDVFVTTEGLLVAQRSPDEFLELQLDDSPAPLLGLGQLPVCAWLAATGFDSGEPRCRSTIEKMIRLPTARNSLCQFWNDSNQNRDVAR